MHKEKTLFICNQCGTEHPKWQGQCRGCSSWNTLIEELLTPKVAPSIENKNISANMSITLDKPVFETTQNRQSTGFSEIDRVLGGGLFNGSYVLIGGSPGIGKSTLLLQTAGGLASSQTKVLYISAEESVQQTALRARRLRIKNSHIEITSESQLEKIIKLVKKKKPQVLILDSIQTIYMSALTSAPGSVSQVRECAAQLMGLCKNMEISTFIIGHVTKDGGLAGPKVLEHIVDTVLSFEGDGHNQFRLLRSLKNRFGPANELGVFEMQSDGLCEVSNPSKIFLNENREGLIGSAIFCAMEGTRPVLCEIQALTNLSPLSMPRRVSLGIDINRIHLLTAVMDRKLSTQLFKRDVFINVVGGLKVSEPFADLAVCAALISCQKDQTLNSSCLFLGELGLTGEIRPLSLIESRIKESEKLGFKNCILPKSSLKSLKNIKTKLKFFPIQSIGELPELLEKLIGLKEKNMTCGDLQNHLKDNTHIRDKITSNIKNKNTHINKKQNHINKNQNHVNKSQNKNTYVTETPTFKN